jgi:hypothetical protein
VEATFGRGFFETGIFFWSSIPSQPIAGVTNRLSGTGPRSVRRWAG